MKVLVTGGPTRAYLDKVRYLSNVSSGKLAFELCDTLIRMGHRVCLVSGPASTDFSSLALTRWEKIETTEEMRESVMRCCKEFRPDWGIFAAAVLDFQPQRIATGKRRSVGEWELKLIPTPKILDEVGKRYPEIKRVGFKLETDKKGKRWELQFATYYMRQKRLDGLCVNYLADIVGNKHAARLYQRGTSPKSLATKRQIARSLSELISHNP